MGRLGRRNLEDLAMKTGRTGPLGQGEVDQSGVEIRTSMMHKGLFADIKLKRAMLRPSLIKIQPNQRERLLWS
ncbi:unnamed protein product [Nezara viridula]|uniref:Uncharacterized protein n=1 Tax=Nezara viridula TaxID=85310 RepID=A0A9P0H9A9_NEZVI|nr:unnamed protein product [Nezara viridula]